MSNDIKALVEELLERARIRRQIPSRKSVQEGKPDRIADLLERAAAALAPLAEPVGVPTEDLYMALCRSCIERLMRADIRCEPLGDVMLRLETVIRRSEQLDAATALARQQSDELTKARNTNKYYADVLFAKAEASAVPGGYVVVPGEPTEEMYRLCDPVIGAKWPHTTYECAGFIYKAMLSAAPPAGWVSVKDRLPDEDGRLWAILIDESIGGHVPLTPAYEYYHFHEGWATDEEVLYWLDYRLPPLPSLPGESG